MKKIGSITFIIAVVIIAALASCVKDLDNEKEKSGDGTALVTLTLSMPSSPTSRAAATPDENAIDQIDVLLFDASDLPDQPFLYRAAGTVIDQGTTLFATKQFEVKLPIGGPYSVIVLANARAAITSLSPALPISTLVPASDPLAIPRVDVLNDLVFGLPVGVTNFPMWGYRDGLSISETSSNPVATVALTRAVARVDVSLGALVDNFELKHVYLYNYNDSGSVAPAASTATGNVDGYDCDQWQPDADPPCEKKSVAPNIPASASKGTTPVHHEMLAGQDSEFRQAIYAFEAEEGIPVPSAGWENNTCLVIGGMYDDGINTPYLTYYRVEFRSGTDPASYDYLPLLRNHLYDVVIQAVNAHGWDDPDVAATNLPSNIIVDIDFWNESKLNDIVFNDQYYLAVNKSHLDFYVEGIPKIIKVKTDFPGKWEVEELPDWLEVVSISPAAAVNTRSALTLGVKSSEPLVPPSREDYFYLVAGNLKKKITVKQVDEIEFWLAVTDEEEDAVHELFFRAGSFEVPPVEQKFLVRWLPESIDVDVETYPGAIPFLYTGGSYDFSAPAITGTFDVVSRVAEITVKPPYNGTPNVRSTRVDFSVELGGQYRLFPFYLRQEKAVPPIYTFSPDWTTLTLFSNYPYSMIEVNHVPELADATIAGKVTTLVIEGNTTVTSEQVKGISNAVNGGVLPALANVSLPYFTGTIPSAFDYQGWLTSFSAPVATAIGNAAFRECTSLSSIDFPLVTNPGITTFYGCTSLTDVILQSAEIFSFTFHSCTNLRTLEIPAAKTFDTYWLYNCPSMETLKVAYWSEITSGSLGNMSNRNPHIDLFLGTDEYTNADVPNTTWKGYKWKSINPYVLAP